MSIGEMRWRGAASIWDNRPSRLVTLLAAIASLLAIGAASARANPGYELNASPSSKSLNGALPHGIAVDQSNQRIYVAIVTASPINLASGQVVRFESNLAAAGTFTTSVGGSKTAYTGVAINPVTHGFYAAQSVIHQPSTFGTAKMDIFSSSGTAGTPFALTDTETLPQIATDSTGNVYYPNAATDSVQVFDSAGSLQEEITCSGCTGGSFGRPATVALDSDDNLYVVDLAPDRVVKLTPSGGTYVFASVLQSGKGAGAVAVDPSNDDVMVGDLPNGVNYHVVAYHSSGVQFDDFGGGTFASPPPEYGVAFVGQLAVDGISHRVYVGEKDKFFIFNRVGTAAVPTATTEPAAPVGQLSATLHASVNVKGHAALECEFEYTDDADFQTNGFANALTLPCPKLPTGTSTTKLETKISGLTPGTTYHYRVSTATYAGSATGSDMPFQALPSLPPAVTTEPAQGVSKSAATLVAKVNPRGGTVSDCHFEYGTSVSYGTNLPCSKLPEAVATDVPQSRNISGLSLGATYHYRLVVTSNAGTSKGNDVEFTAVDPPPPPDPGGGGGSPPPGTPPTVTPPTVTPPPVATPPKPPLRCKKGFRKKMVRGKAKCVKKKPPAKHRHAHR